MKIYFSGAHSSGKSTLANYISKQYNLPLIKECARTVLSEKELNINELRTNIDLVNDYQTSVFIKQIEEENKYDDFISDRSGIDSIAYSAQHSQIAKDIIKLPAFEHYIEKLKNKNSIIFFIRPSKHTLKEDGVREHISWDGIVGIDAMLKLLFEIFDIRYFNINTPNMQERIKIINSVLSL